MKKNICYPVLAQTTICLLPIAIFILLQLTFLAGAALGWEDRPSQNHVKSEEGTIQRITKNSIQVNDQTYSIDRGVKVKRKGFQFEIEDLRPGWKVCLKLKDEQLKEIEVEGIPSVIDYPEYRGTKTRVAVGRLRLGTLPNDVLQSSVDLQSAVESIILAALEATGKFIIIDIRSRDEILNELDYSQTSYANRELAHPVGRQIPAKYVVRGHVISFGLEKKNGKGFGAFGVNLGSKKTEMDLKMQLTLEEIATGNIVKSYTEGLRFSSKGAAIGIDAAGIASSLASFTSDIDKLKVLQKVAGTGVQFTKDSYYESPLGEVFGVVVNRLVERLAGDMVGKTWTGVVVSVVDKNVVVRGGKDVGLKKGDALQVIKSTKELVDPETGLSLGSISAPNAILVVNTVQEKVSICTYKGSARISRGDKCVLTNVRTENENIGE